MYIIYLKPSLCGIAIEGMVFFLRWFKESSDMLVIIVYFKSNPNYYFLLLLLRVYIICRINFRYYNLLIGMPFLFKQDPPNGVNEV